MSELEIEVVSEKNSHADRIRKDMAARKRRQQVKAAREVHEMKERKEAIARMKADRAKAKMQKRKKAP